MRAYGRPGELMDFVRLGDWELGRSGVVVVLRTAVNCGGRLVLGFE